MTSTRRGRSIWGAPRLTAVWARVAVVATILASVVVIPALDAHADSTRMAADNANTGWYPDQPLLTPSAVQVPGAFGSTFDTTLTTGAPTNCQAGKIYAQPLVDQGQVLAVTENDCAYGVSTASAGTGR